MILVVASGNQAKVGYSPLLDHPWIVPVVAMNEQGSLNRQSNISSSIGKLGVMAPGENITSTSPNGGYIQMTGTSVAAPFVTGTIALLWSEFPNATASEIKYSITATTRCRTIIPAKLNAETAWSTLKTIL